MKITCIGAGPAGLYLPILMKNRDPGHDITIYERNGEGATNGWGVTYGEDFIPDLMEGDPVSAREIIDHSFRWLDTVVEIAGRRPARHEGHSGYGISRRKLMEILSRRARDLGVSIRYGVEVDPAADFPDQDVVIAADGVGSRMRQSRKEEFKPAIFLGRNKYVWLGTTRVFDSFTFAFVETEAGWIWFYAYGFGEGMSTLIAECSPETWAGLGFDRFGADDALAELERIFAGQLGEHRLFAQGCGGSLPWLNFSRLTNGKWHAGRMALAGDAAHTTHFSIGCGTRLAIQDALSLARHLGDHVDIPSALDAYESERTREIASAQRDAHLSSLWYEDAARHMHLDASDLMEVMLNRCSPSPLSTVLPPRLLGKISRWTGRIPLVRPLRKMAGNAYRKRLRGGLP
jgi:2-polyprenyl-6-methoxyphenol hydroxylase-like FAD-dependent oxidoreductase